MLFSFSVLQNSLRILRNLMWSWLLRQPQWLLNGLMMCVDSCLSGCLVGHWRSSNLQKSRQGKRMMLAVVSVCTLYTHSLPLLFCSNFRFCFVNTSSKRTFSEWWYSANWIIELLKKALFFNVVPFGLDNALSSFKWIMNKVKKGNKYSATLLWYAHVS